MGNSADGKPVSEERTYYQSQIELFRWRADPNSNSFLPRIYFCKKQQQMQRRSYNHLLARQLDQQFFIDIDEISHLLRKEKARTNEGEIILFEKYAARLSLFHQQLDLGECLYVLNGLLEGYERILNKLGKTYIESDYCFVTLKGEIRAWFTNSPTSNQFAEEEQPQNDFTYECIEAKAPVKYSSEAGVIKRLLELNLQLSNCSQEYLHFYSQINQYIGSNILHHSSLSSARKFINKYLFRHRILLPYNIMPALQRMTSRQNSSYNSSQREVQFEERPNQTGGTNGFLSTDATFDQIRARKQPFEQIKNTRISSINNIHKVPIYKEQLSMAEITENEESKLTHTPTVCCRTPNNERQYKTLQSTFVHSQLLQSRNDQKQNEKWAHDQSRINEKCKGEHEKKYSQIHQPPPDFRKSKKELGYKSAKVSVKFHSRQPSLEQETNSMLVPASHAKMEKHEERQAIVTVKRTANNCKEEGKGQKKHQHLLVRQVSGLVSNRDLSICQSLGTFQSIDCMDSGYRGVLTKMGRTAKMLNLPTGKRLTHFRTSPEGTPSSSS